VIKPSFFYLPPLSPLYVGGGKRRGAKNLRNRKQVFYLDINTYTFKQEEVILLMNKLLEGLPYLKNLKFNLNFHFLKKKFFLYAPLWSVKKKIKYFQFSTYGSKEKALQAAVSSRNSVLKKHLEEFQ
jgi:hypothetical protein